MPVPQLKKKLWVIFSLYIRLRDSNNKGICTCCSCGIKLPYKGSRTGTRMNAGHFFQQRGNPKILFNEKNVHAQCSKCNRKQKSGEGYAYYLYIRDLYGEEEVHKLYLQCGKPFKFTREWLNEKIEYYTFQVEKLLKQKKLSQ